MTERIRDWWEDFLWDNFKKRRWPGIFVFIEWAQAQLMCLLRLCDDCSHCETYICWGCMRRLPWSNGCADKMGDVCDDCWGEWNIQHE